MGTQAFSLQTFNDGDTNYIAKMNANGAAIVSAIAQLQLVNNGAAAQVVSVGNLLAAIFGNVAIIGTTSYSYTLTGSKIVFGSGFGWRGASQQVVSSLPCTLDLSSYAAGTYYVSLATNGLPTLLSTADTAVIFTLQWTGNAITTVTRMAPIFFAASDDDATLESTANAMSYASLESRLEWDEAAIKAAIAEAQAAMSAAQAAQTTANGNVVEATATTLGVVKFDNSTIAINANGQLYVTQNGKISVLLQINGTNAGSQAKLNLVEGVNISLVDDGAGNITINSAASNTILPAGGQGLVVATPATKSGTSGLRALVSTDLPVATSTAPGAVYPDGTTCSVDGSGKLTVIGGTGTGGGGTFTPPSGPGNEFYATPDGATGQAALRRINVDDLSQAAATATQIGAVKPDGTTVTVASDGTLTAQTATLATANKPGIARPDGITLTINGSGVMSAVATADLPAGSGNEFLASPADGSAGATALRAIVPADLPTATTAAKGAVKADGTTIKIAADGTISAPAAASVTSVALSAPTSLFTVSGSPVTSSGTLSIALKSQAAGLFLAGPTSGTAVPTMRAIVASDLAGAIATSTTAGVVKPDGTTIVVDQNGVLSTQIGQPNGAPNLVMATPVSTTGNATLRALTPADLPAASTTAAGIVKPDGTTLQISGGVLSAPAAVVPSGSKGQVYAAPVGAAGNASMRNLQPSDLPVATNAQLGAVQPDGTTVTITSAGVITAVAPAPAAPTGTANQVYASPDGAAGSASMRSMVANDLPSNAIVGGVTITVDGGGSTPVAGSMGLAPVPYHAVVTGWTLVAENSNGPAAATCTFDIKKSTVAGLGLGTSIIGSNGPAPTLSNATGATNNSVSGWTNTTINAGDVLEFILSSPGGAATRYTLILQLKRT